MSLPSTGEELPKKGKELPSERSHKELVRAYARAIGDALKEELARGASIKTIMAWTGAGERTVKGWLAGANGPSGPHLEGLLRSSEVVYRRVMLRTGRAPIVNRLGLEVLRGQAKELLGALDAALSQQP